MRGLVALLTVGVVLLSTAVSAGAHACVSPREDSLRFADAILVLGGDSYDRYPFGIALAKAGWAPNLVISNPVGERHPWVHRFCMEPDPGVAVTCFAPQPHSTRGEARFFKQLAEKYGWQSVIVVTFRPQIARARYILERCFAGELIMVETPTRLTASRWAYEILYQTAGYGRAFLQPGC